MRVLTLALLVGCSHPPQTTLVWPATPGKIEIVSDKPRCYIPDAPLTPVKPDWPSAEEDFYRRVYVHRKDYELLFDYAIMVAERQEALIDCIRSVTDAY